MRKGRCRFPRFVTGLCSSLVKIVLEPVFEADMLPCSFGFRPRRSVHDALQVLIDECWRGCRWVVETDIADCFSAISHQKLMQAVQERVLYTAGMTGQDPILAALGTALGSAVRDPDKADEAEPAHWHGQLAQTSYPHPEDYDRRIGQILRNQIPSFYWLPENLANESGYTRNPVDICIAGLMGSGLIQSG